MAVCKLPIGVENKSVTLLLGLFPKIKLFEFSIYDSSFITVRADESRV